MVARRSARKQFFSAGTDWRWVDGDSEEDGLDAATGTQVTLKRISGGTQRSLGAVRAGRHHADRDSLTMTLSARVDQLAQLRRPQSRDERTRAACRPPTTHPTLPDRDDTVVSPRVAARYHLNDRSSACGATSAAGFRAPTLNELYRQFRVGTVLTLANNQLGPERLVGGELGVDYMPRPQHHVALDLVRQPRQGSGLERDDHAPSAPTSRSSGRTSARRASAGCRPTPSTGSAPRWRFSGGYLYDQAKVREFAANPALVGKFLPQVPEHRGSVQVVYSNPRFVDLAFMLQALGSQFDDDLNVRTVPGITEPGLPGYGARVVHRLARRRAATSKRSSACRTSSTRNTSSARCPRPSDPHGW